MGLNTSLNTAISGLRATQIGIGVVSQNVANAGTTGYVRRSVSNADSLSGLTVGVQSTQVQRLLDKIVQHQLWQESAGAGYTSTRASALSNLDKLYGAPGSATALDTLFNGFTSALQGLQNDPSSYSLRSQVMDSASALARQLNTLSAGVQTLRSEAENGIASGIQQVNDLLGALSKVNAKIVGSPQDDATASLKDQRDLILSQLSQFVDIKTSEDSRGSISVVTGSGAQLFDGQAAVQFSFDARAGLTPSDQWSTNSAQRGVGTIVIRDLSGNTSDAIANNVFRSGQIGAQIELRDRTLVQAQAQLDEIAAQMAKALSDREIGGTAATIGADSGLQVSSTALQRGNALTLDYKASSASAAQRISFVNVATGTSLPASAQGDANNRVVAVDFSAGDATIQSTIQGALPTGFTASVTGGVVTIVADGTGGRTVAGLTARPTNTALSSASGSAELPFFVDGAGDKVFTGSYEGSSQAQGFAARIKINPALANDPKLLVQFSTGTAIGDTTRPKLMLDRLTTSQRAVSNRIGLDGGNATTSGTVSNLVQRVVATQGQAVESAQRLDEGQQVALASVQSRFQATSQVNVDQEMSTLIELQTAYAANARIISTVKEMMDVLMRV